MLPSNTTITPFLSCIHSLQRAPAYSPVGGGGVWGSAGSNMTASSIRALNRFGPSKGDRLSGSMPGVRESGKPIYIFLLASSAFVLFSSPEFLFFKERSCFTLFTPYCSLYSSSVWTRAIPFLRLSPGILHSTQKEHY
ncbi:hypothetical protein DL89DRAFT_27318 [Linderina pennispora]|uniref:Uncharacterized protein n=1 Tax=Linderina pennispora TaxID=61395 RepID=A0A1Y1W3L9_9FUNG|nr:uncharacterized protein DL89DRAFT_27318 [Linderina pennispora]ORX68149.1 hypothetical protein DL89DRAFT_27318 [Linderina pennispora]